MRDLRLDGVEVCRSMLTPKSFRAASCEFLLPITPANKDERIEEFKREGEFGKYSGLRVSGIADLSFLSEFPDLRFLEVLEQKRVNTRQLDGLTNLRGLRIETPGAGIDFSCFPHLEFFVGDWHVDNCNLDQSRELRLAHIWQFKPRTRDLSDFARTVRLESLDIIQTSITSLTGFDQLEDLRYLTLAYAPQLESLDALAASEAELRELSIEKAKRISSYRPIASLSRLRRLRLSSCAPMPDLEWTAGLNRLDFFSFVETNVENGDLSPLLKLPALESVGTMDKKHYNKKCDHLNELLKQRRSLTD
jgi:hypothetical protein